MTFTGELLARARRSRRRIGFPEALDPRILQAALRLAAESVVEPVLVGDEEAIARAIEALGAEPDLEVVDAGSGSGGAVGGGEALARSADLLRAGSVDGVVAGAVYSTAEVVRAGLQIVGLRPGCRTLSSSFYMEVGNFRGGGTEVLTFTDAGVVPEPDPLQLCEIAAEAARARRLIVGDEPRVAFLSYSTKGSAEGRSVDVVREALARFRDMHPDVLADGELQGDAALIPEVAAHKSPGSELAGRANVLVFPDLDSGNIAYKLVHRLAAATALGPILQGLTAPLNDLSRGADVTDIVHVAAITALMASAHA